MGINAQLDAPARFQAKGLGSGGAKGCPKDTWCVQNAGNYRGSMSVTDALATSPNTAFAKLISQVGVQRTVDMAVKLGLRSYADAGHRARLRPGEQREPRRLRQAAEPRLVHAGPDRGQRARTVERRRHAGLRWHVVPAQPDRQALRPQRQRGVGHHRDLRAGGARGPGQHPGQRDEQGRRCGGTAAGSAGSAGWNLPMSGKTGTTEAHRSSGFLGFTNHYAAANYIYDDSTNPADLCSFPLRQCGDGNLFGGNEPARTWFTAMKPIADDFGDVAAAADRSALRRRRARVRGCRASSGMIQDAARKRLRDAGFQVADQATPVNSAAPARRRRRHVTQRADRARVRSSRSRSATASRRHRRRPAGGAADPGLHGRVRPDRRRDPRLCRRSRFRCWPHHRRRRDAGHAAVRLAGRSSQWHRGG